MGIIADQFPRGLVHFWVVPKGTAVVIHRPIASPENVLQLQLRKIPEAETTKRTTVPAEGHRQHPTAPPDNTGS